MKIINFNSFVHTSQIIHPETYVTLSVKNNLTDHVKVEQVRYMKIKMCIKELIIIPIF